MAISVSAAISQDVAVSVYALQLRSVACPRKTALRTRFSLSHKKPVDFSNIISFRLSANKRLPAFIARASSEQGKNSNSVQGNHEENGQNSGDSNAASKNSRKPSPDQSPGKWKNRKWNWDWRETLGIQLREIVALFLQLGIVFFLMKVMRPRVPFPGSEARVPTTYVSVPFSEFLSRINNNQVQKVEVDDVHFTFRLKSEFAENVAVLDRAGKRVLYTTTRPSDIKTPYEKMLENQVEFGAPDRRSGGFFSSAIISAGRLKNRKTRRAGGLKSAELGEMVTFSDVAGVDEAKEELEEIVEFLRNPDRYTRLGARPPRGVLLVGLPGTGKTLLAKAVAGEAEVPFISCSASEFVELYVGMGASRVRDLFTKAKKEAPAIVFIDEIDAVAKSRDGRIRVVSNDEREQTLNQLLTEMDGFESNSSVIVLGATNRADVLDPALRRPGRFDRIVQVEAPNRGGREAILKVHIFKRQLPLSSDVDLNAIATATTGFTGADLANLVNEAALLAGRANKETVSKEDFMKAVERAVAGIEKKRSTLQRTEKAVVARHEAGHAVVGTAVANLLSGQPQVEKLSILPRSGGALGFTYTPPGSEDRYLLFVDELRGRLVTLLGGRAAEEFAYKGRVSTGALDDIRRATDMAYKAIAEYGLNQSVGPISLATLSSGGLDESGGSIPWGRDQGHIVELVQKEVKALLQSALAVALLVIRSNPTVLEGLGAQLEADEKVDGEILRGWLKLVVPPRELASFINGEYMPSYEGCGIFEKAQTLISGEKPNDLVEHT